MGGLVNRSQSKIKRSEIIEITASFFGFESWHHFVDAAEKYSRRLMKPYMACHYRNNNKVTHMDFCCGEASAFTLFSKKLNQVNSKAFNISRYMCLYITTNCNEKDNDSYLDVSHVSEIEISTSTLSQYEVIANSSDICQSLFTFFGISLPNAAKLRQRAMRRSGNSSNMIL